MNTYTVYFLYDNFNNLLYVGKTKSLRTRFHGHFNRTMIEKEPWKNEVDTDNIIIYTCLNECDMDIYETYFINKYRPKHNKDKVFETTSSFELPYLEPVSLKKKYEEAQIVIDCFNANLDNDMLIEGFFRGADPNYLYKRGNKLKLTTF